MPKQVMVSVLETNIPLIFYGVNSESNNGPTTIPYPIWKSLNYNDKIYPLQTQ